MSTQQDGEIPRIPSSHVRPGSSALKQIFRAPAALITDVALTDDNSELLRIARALGEIGDVVARPTRSAELHGVYRVEALANPVKDSLGTTVLSTSHEEFELHSDHFFLEKVADYVLLQCWRCNDPKEYTCFASAKSICEDLTDDAFHHLSTTPVMGGFGKRFILAGPRKNPTIFYNGYEIEKLSSRGRLTVPAVLHPYFKELENAAKRCAVTVPVQPGDCLVMNNKRVLHGRRFISESSNRLLKRVRVHVTDPKYAS